MRNFIKKILPNYLFRSFSILREKGQLNKIHSIPCNAYPLAKSTHIRLDDIFHSVMDEEWGRMKSEVISISSSDQTGGVNPGDRRAIYYLVRYLKPKIILEIGTHVGASTIHFALALKGLKLLENMNSVNLVTVDINDVNDPTSTPWKKYGSAFSPKEMVKMIGCEDIVKFIISDSLHYFSNSDQKYDLIFLDGDHSAPTVYQEIPAAIKALNKGGYILLHDYFPNLRPLWSDGALIPGPYLAIKRLSDEHVNIDVLPLGKLRWLTKSGSNFTSLALLGA